MNFKNLSKDEQDLIWDLDVTELMYFKTKDKVKRRAINNLRYFIILELHRLRFPGGDDGRYI